jgi:hypothetical protein
VALHVSNSAARPASFACLLAAFLQAARRVLGTILGACLGLATNSIPGIFESPALLVACLALASVGLGVLARPQRRTAIVLALLTLCAVSLCGYEAACCSPRGGMSPLHTFVARMASVSVWLRLCTQGACFGQVGTQILYLPGLRVCWHLGAALLWAHARYPVCADFV